MTLHLQEVVCAECYMYIHMPINIGVLHVPDLGYLHVYSPNLMTSIIVLW